MRRKIRQHRKKGTAGPGWARNILNQLCSIIHARAGEGSYWSGSDRNGEKWLASA